jgi:AcrR family transcriptional regulator
VPAATKKAEQSEATRGKLIGVARELFARKGYAGVSIEEIVQAADVTRGALYHHYDSKRELFGAVHDDVQRELTARIQSAAAAEPDVERHLEAGCMAFLDACLDADVQRVVLLDAPSVLGWELWREVDLRISLGMLRQALETGMRSGYFERQPVDPLAQVLLGALNEAGLFIARAEDPVAARTEAGRTVSRLLAGLRPGR